MKKPRGPPMLKREDALRSGRTQDVRELMLWKCGISSFSYFQQEELYHRPDFWARRGRVRWYKAV